LRAAYEPALKAVAAHFRLKEPDDARDTVHQVAAYLLDVLARGRQTKRIRKAKQFLVRSAINTHKRRLAAARRLLLWDDLVEEKDRIRLECAASPAREPWEIVAAKELGAIAWAEMWRLPPGQRIVVHLRISGHSFRQIGRALGISAGAARDRAHRGLGKLRRRFGLAG
jgi:RNA polymerase sigma factor (sigma-70 family)